MKRDLNFKFAFYNGLGSFKHNNIKIFECIFKVITC